MIDDLELLSVSLNLEFSSGAMWYKEIDNMKVVKSTVDSTTEETWWNCT